MNFIALEDHDAEVKGLAHLPVLKQTETPEPLCMGSWVVGCTCGWNDPYFWAAEEGARSAFVEHIHETFVPDDWPTLVCYFEE